MARSQTNLDIDLLTIADLYNRGYYLSTNTTYIPTISTIGAFSKWINKPLVEIFQPLFYDYDKYNGIGPNLSTGQTLVSNLSTSLLMPVNTVFNFSNNNYSTITIFSTIVQSTVSGYTDVANLNSTSASYAYSNVSTAVFTIGPIIAYTVNKFYDNLFAPTASTLVQNAIYNYISRDRINEFTYNSVTNTTPRFNGVFGRIAGAPVPWYWQGSPILNIGPGLSSISTIFQSASYPFYINISTNFSNILHTTSTGLYNSNSTLNSYERIVNSSVVKLLNSYDNLSSILISYSNASTIFDPYINNASNFNINVNNIRSSLTSEIINTNTSTFNGVTLGLYISTANFNLGLRSEFLINQLNNSISSGVLITHLNSFSTIVESTLTVALSTFNKLDFYPGFYQVSSIYSSNIRPVYDSVNISTLQLGFLSLSSFNASIFSSILLSTPYIINSNIFSQVFNDTELIIANSLNSITLVTNTLNICSARIPGFNATIQGPASILPNITQLENPTVVLPNYTIYTTTPNVTNNTSLYSYYSTIVLNNGLSIVKSYNSLYGYIGINTLRPSYAIDIAIGDARKPSGTVWVTPSDLRVKENVSEVSSTELEVLISLIRLVEFNWSPEYSEKFSVPSERILGFISQEIQKILPDSVKDSQENGYSDFKSLDVDQIFKIKYAITRNLLERVSTLTLRINGLMKES